MTFSWLSHDFLITISWQSLDILIDYGSSPICIFFLNKFGDFLLNWVNLSLKYLFSNLLELIYFCWFLNNYVHYSLYLRSFPIFLLFNKIFFQQNNFFNNVSQYQHWSNALSCWVADIICHSPLLLGNWFSLWVL